MKQLITTDRGVFNVRLYGNVSHPPLFLIHGWPQTSYCWHHAAQHITSHYIIAPDIRGMGDSNRALELEYYTKDEMAKDIFAIADALEIDQFNLGGHDWGGAIVQEMAFLHPERIRKLIILNMIILNNKNGQKKAGQILVQQQFRSSWYQYLMSIKAFPEALLAGKEEIWIRFFSRGISNPIPEDAIQEYIRCYKIPHTITTASNIYRAVKKDRVRWEAFLGKNITIPTQIIHGVLDPVIIKEYIEGVEDYFSEVEVHKLNGGHFICDEQPQEVAHAIVEFLNK